MSANQIKPDDAVAHYSLGLVYKQQGCWDAAIRELRIAVQLGFEPARELLAELGQTGYTREDSTGASRGRGVRAPAQYTTPVCPNCGSALTRYIDHGAENSLEVFVCDTCGWSGESRI